MLIVYAHSVCCIAWSIVLCMLCSAHAHQFLHYCFLYRFISVVYISDCVCAVSRTESIILWALEAASRTVRPSIRYNTHFPQRMLTLTSRPYIIGLHNNTGDEFFMSFLLRGTLDFPMWSKKHWANLGILRDNAMHFVYLVTLWKQEGILRMFCYVTPYTYCGIEVVKMDLCENKGTVKHNCTSMCISTSN